MAICKKCGSQLREGAGFCDVCGARTNESTKVVNLHQNNVYTPPAEGNINNVAGGNYIPVQKKKSIPLYVIIPVIVIMITVAVTGYFVIRSISGNGDSSAEKETNGKIFRIDDIEWGMSADELESDCKGEISDEEGSYEGSLIYTYSGYEGFIKEEVIVEYVFEDDSLVMIDITCDDFGAKDMETFAEHYDAESWTDDVRGEAYYAETDGCGVNMYSVPYGIVIMPVQTSPRPPKEDNGEVLEFLKNIDWSVTVADVMETDLFSGAVRDGNRYSVKFKNVVGISEGEVSLNLYTDDGEKISRYGLSSDDTDEFVNNVFASFDYGFKCRNVNVGNETDSEVEIDYEKNYGEDIYIAVFRDDIIANVYFQKGHNVSANKPSQIPLKDRKAGYFYIDEVVMNASAEEIKSKASGRLKSDNNTSIFYEYDGFEELYDGSCEVMFGINGNNQMYGLIVSIPYSESSWSQAIAYFNAEEQTDSDYEYVAEWGERRVFFKLGDGKFDIYVL